MVFVLIIVAVIIVVSKCPQRKNRPFLSDGF